MKQKATLLLTTLVLILISNFKSVAQVVTLGNETFTTNKNIVADKVIFKRGCKMKITNGATLTIDAKEIEIEATYFIDATGNVGNTGASKGDWCAHNCNCGGGFLDLKNQGHEDFEKQKALGDKENKGGTGGNGSSGGNIIISYCNLSGIVGGIANLRTDCTGGEGGSGGRGLKLICPCHSSETFIWSSGNKGEKGVDGIFRYIRKGDCN